MSEGAELVDTRRLGRVAGPKEAMMSETTKTRRLVAALEKSEAMADAYRRLGDQAQALDLPDEAERAHHIADEYRDDAEATRDQLAATGYLPPEA